MVRNKQFIKPLKSEAHCTVYMAVASKQKFEGAQKVKKSEKLRVQPVKCYNVVTAISWVPLATGLSEGNGVAVITIISGIRL